MKVTAWGLPARYWKLGRYEFYYAPSENWCSWNCLITRSRAFPVPFGASAKTPWRALYDVLRSERRQIAATAW